MMPQRCQECDPNVRYVLAVTEREAKTIWGGAGTAADAHKRLAIFQTFSDDWAHHKVWRRDQVTNEVVEVPDVA